MLIDRHTVDEAWLEDHSGVRYLTDRAVLGGLLDTRQPPPERPIVVEHHSVTVIRTIHVRITPRLTIATTVKIITTRPRPTDQPITTTTTTTTEEIHQS